MILLSPIKRRIIYVALFEVFAIILSTLILMSLSGGNASGSLAVATVVSAIAVTWNYLYNTLFETWERRANIRQRTFGIRCLHSVGFECGLLVTTLPLYMFWYGVSLWKSFTMVGALLVFFIVYTFVFTLLFDKVFILPHQAKPI